MRKSYRPLERIQKATENYKKKTLNINDNLNLQIDENEIENVEEYWKMANSVIASETIEEENNTNETLFDIKNIRKSIKNTQKIKEEDFINKNINDTLLSNNLIENDSIGENNDILFNNSLLSNNLLNDETNKLNINNENINNENINNENSANEINSFINSNLEINENLFNSSKNLNEDSEFFNENSETDKNNENKNSMKFILNKSKPKEHKKHNKSKIHKANTIYNENEIGNLNIIEKNNSLEGVLVNDKINVGYLNLTYKSSVIKQKALYDFMIFVYSGKVEIDTEKEKKILNRGNIKVINKGEDYEIKGISINGSKLMFTYIL